MKIAAMLDFSNPNNACLSLRTIAELVRSGDVRLHEAKTITSPGNMLLTLDLSESGAMARPAAKPSGRSEAPGR